MTLGTLFCRIFTVGGLDCFVFLKQCEKSHILEHMFMQIFGLSEAGSATFGNQLHVTMCFRCNNVSHADRSPVKALQILLSACLCE